MLKGLGWMLCEPVNRVEVETTRLEWKSVNQVAKIIHALDDDFFFFAMALTFCYDKLYSLYVLI